LICGQWSLDSYSSDELVGGIKDHSYQL